MKFDQNLLTLEIQPAAILDRLGLNSLTLRIVRNFTLRIMAGQPTPPGHVPPPRNKGLIADLIKGNQWLISPDHKALFLGGYVRGG